jgi:hypothetical protein
MCNELSAWGYNYRTYGAAPIIFFARQSASIGLMSCLCVGFAFSWRQPAIDLRFIGVLFALQRGVPRCLQANQIDAGLSLAPRIIGKMQDTALTYCRRML